MGGKIQGCISNATQWQVKYNLRQTMLQTKGVKVVTDWNVGGSLNGKYGKKKGLQKQIKEDTNDDNTDITKQIKEDTKEGKTDTTKQKQIKEDTKEDDITDITKTDQPKPYLGRKVDGKINANYGNKGTTNINRIQAEGAIIITPDSSSRSGLQFKATQQNPRYLSIWVQHPTKGDILLMENMRVETEKDMRKCIWVGTNGQLKISQLAQEPNTWRFAKGCGQQRNYPPGHSCVKCKRSQSCSNGCAQKQEYGGL